MNFVIVYAVVLRRASGLALVYAVFSVETLEL